MDNNKKIYIIITGGTIDSSTKGAERDTLLEHSAVPEYIQSLKIDQSFEFRELMMKDSRDITDGDRQKILQEIEQSYHNKIIITHGTFTLAETGKFLKSNLTRKDQAIILTGAMTPLNFENSDGPANLRFSIEQINHLSPGIYLAFNGRIFDPEEAVKDVLKEKFYSVNDK